MVDIFTAPFCVHSRRCVPAFLKKCTLPCSIPKLSEWEIKEKVLDFVVKSSTFFWSEWRDSKKKCDENLCKMMSIDLAIVRFVGY